MIFFTTINSEKVVCGRKS